MKPLRLAALLCASFPALAADALPGATLTVDVSDIGDARGHLLLVVEASADGWNGREVEAAKARIAVAADTVRHRFEGLPAGDYAVQVLHDANDNGEMDKNFLGIPSEGYGFSNNPRVMRRATFEEARFDLPAGGATIAIRLR